MEASVEVGVEMSVEMDSPSLLGSATSLQIRLLGPLTISRDGITVPLPASRKARALLAYLTLAPHPVPRGQLCELLWDVPNDPRGELRWCLSKIRRIVDHAGPQRVDACADTIRLDLADCLVDAIEITRAAQKGIEDACHGTTRKRCPRCLRETLSRGWRSTAAQASTAGSSRSGTASVPATRRYLSNLPKAPPATRSLSYLRKWLQIAPFDLRAHETLLNALAQRGRIREGEEHLAVAARQFEDEGLDPAPIRDAWRAARVRTEALPQIRVLAPAQPPALFSGPQENGLSAPRRASVAIMPFAGQCAATSVPGGPGDGLAYDVITRLAKLRCLFVIAQGTVFALRERRLAPEEAGRILNVDYVVSGSLKRQDNCFTVAVELVETRTAHLVWAEVYHKKTGDAFLMLDEIGNKIVASIAHEIEIIERNRAILRPPNSLDAWGAHHRGLWHMYRFSKTDNEQARHFFQMAVRLDPTFARAYAGLSFTHFQNVLQGWARGEPEMDLAFETAGQSLMADDRDPAAHWAMGRALWLRRRHEQSIAELERSIELSPNFAQGHYALSFVGAQAGDPSAAVASCDYSRDLSPFDPMLCAMLATRSIALMRLGRFDEAAEWAVKGAARPNAFAIIRAIAAYSLALAGRQDEARGHLASIRKALPHYGIDDFLTAMRFSPEGEALIRKGAMRMGME